MTPAEYAEMAFQGLIPEPPAEVITEADIIDPATEECCHDQGTTAEEVDGQRYRMCDICGALGEYLGRRAA